MLPLLWQIKVWNCYSLKSPSDEISHMEYYHHSCIFGALFIDHHTMILHCHRRRYSNGGCKLQWFRPFSATVTEHSFCLNIKLKSQLIEITHASAIVHYENHVRHVWFISLILSSICKTVIWMRVVWEQYCIWQLQSNYI